MCASPGRTGSDSYPGLEQGSADGIDLTATVIVLLARAWQVFAGRNSHPEGSVDTTELTANVTILLACVWQVFAGRDSHPCRGRRICAM